MATVIVGAGIIGSATAYYLSQSPSSTIPSDIHLIEYSPELFASASGYAAGFLARDWFSHSVASLGELSFDLHKDIAHQNDGARKWGYSRSTGTSLLKVKGDRRGDEWLRDGTSRAETAATHDFADGNGPAWLTKTRNGMVEVISNDKCTAQVDPLRLSRFLLSACMDRGVKLHQPARPVSITKDSSGALASVVIASTSPPNSTTTIPCSRLVITAGAWTPRVFKSLFPKLKKTIPISSLAGHSLLLRSPRWNIGDELKAGGGCHAVFTTDKSGYSPEIFSRVGGEIYIAGLNSATLPLPELPTDRVIDQESIEVLRRTAKRLLGKEDQDDLEILREGLCFRPVGERGTPIIGRVDDETLGLEPKEGSGVWIAAGHAAWGISLSLGTGKVVSEMIEGKKTSADITRLGL